MGKMPPLVFDDTGKGGEKERKCITNERTKKPLLFTRESIFAGPESGYFENRPKTEYHYDPARS